MSKIILGIYRHGLLILRHKKYQAYKVALHTSFDTILCGHISENIAVVTILMTGYTLL